MRGLVLSRWCQRKEEWQWSPMNGMNWSLLGLSQVGEYVLITDDWMTPLERIISLFYLSVRCWKGFLDIFFYYFLDDLSGYFQIPIGSEDQDKMTYTCPFGTIAYWWMSFRLCNTSATFQRCMIAIFDDMIEDIMEVLIVDYSVFGDSFDHC